MFGREQEICIGFMSGASNVHFWLKKRGIPASDKLVQEILAEAKKLDRIMLDQEVLAVVEQSGIRVPSSPA